MNRMLAVVCFALLLSPVSLAMAGGTFPLSQLKPILEQKPALATHLFSTLEFAEWGMASRVGSIVNEKLGGARLGPYRIRAKPKGVTGAYIFEVVVYTKKTFLDEGGNRVALAQASSVMEEFDYLEVRLIEGEPPAK
jgi:hypothetical protein